MVSEIGLHFSLRFFKEVCKLVLCREHFLFSDVRVNLLHCGEIIPSSKEHHFVYWNAERVPKRGERVAANVSAYRWYVCRTAQAVDAVIYV